MFIKSISFSIGALSLVLALGDILSLRTNGVVPNWFLGAAIILSTIMTWIVLWRLPKDHDGPAGLLMFPGIFGLVLSTFWIISYFRHGPLLGWGLIALFVCVPLLLWSLKRVREQPNEKVE